MLNALAVLRDRGVRVGVLSNSWGTGYFNPYRGYQLDQRADAVVYSDQAQVRKPDPAAFKLILAMLDAVAEESVFVDDVPGNLPAARSLGMRTIHHVETIATINDLERLFHVDLHERRSNPDHDH